MKFKELTEEDILYIKGVYSKDAPWDDRINELKTYLGKSERTVRKWLIKLGIKKRPDKEPKQYVDAKKKKADKRYKKFIITWAQNNTPVHEPFLRNLEAYAEEISAKIIIIAGRYKNPTSVFTQQQEDDEFWHKRALPYLYANREKIHDSYLVVGDVKVSPTAVMPMTSMEGFSGSESCIFGHPKCQEEVVPVLEGRPAKKMMTTGSCTVHNYTDSKAGKKGEFHHTLGFVVVEIKDDEQAFSRVVTAEDNGDFYDLWYKVQFKGSNEVDVIPGFKFIGSEDDWKGKSTVKKIKKTDAIVLGDIHFGEEDPEVMDATMNNLFKKLKPETVVLHDVFDGHSISHHDRKDAFAQYFKEMEGKNDLKAEIDYMLDGLEQFKDYNTIVVRSNHDDFLDRWLKDVDWRKEATMKNAPAYMEYAGLILSRKAKKGVIPYLINQRFPKMTTLDRSDSYRIHDWEVGQHGDIGASGSRGSINQFRKLNTKMIIGHSHSPCRKDGVVQVGTSTYLRVGYNIGPSKWMQSHSIIHPNGKAQLISIHDGEFTTFK